MKIGLTGTIGSGKSTVLQVFDEVGWQILDTDQLAREQIKKASVKQELQNRYGRTVFLADGEVDRRELACKVFSNPKELKWLESLLHPLIREEWKRTLASQPDQNWVVEIPLLFEKKLESHFDFTVCVHCSVRLRWQRLRIKGL